MLFINKSGNIIYHFYNRQIQVHYFYMSLTFEPERAVVFQIVVQLFYGVENKSFQPVVAYIQIEEGENTSEETSWEPRQPVVA